MTLPRADQEVATVIQGNIAEMQLGCNLFHGPVRGVSDFIPARSVFCLVTGGPEPSDCHDDDKYISFPQVQVRVRSDRQDYDNGVELARAITEILHNSAPTEITNFIDARTVDSEPNYLGEDEDGHPEWSINVQLTLESNPQ